jgi:hypothetical protein
MQVLETSSHRTVETGDMSIVDYLHWRIMNPRYSATYFVIQPHHIIRVFHAAP